MAPSRQCLVNVFPNRWIFFMSRCLDYRVDNTCFHIFPVPKHQLRQSVAFFTSGRLHWSVKTSSSRRTSCTSNHLLGFCKIALHFEPNQNIIWFARTVQSDISLLFLFLNEKCAWGHRVLFASTELYLFYYSFPICYIMEIIMIEHVPASKETVK